MYKCAQTSTLLIGLGRVYKSPRNFVNVTVTFNMLTRKPSFSDRGKSAVKSPCFKIDIKIDISV